MSGYTAVCSSSSAGIVLSSFHTGVTAFNLASAVLATSPVQSGPATWSGSIICVLVAMAFTALISTAILVRQHAQTDDYKKIPECPADV